MRWFDFSTLYVPMVGPAMSCQKANVDIKNNLLNHSLLPTHFFFWTFPLFFQTLFIFPTLRCVSTFELVLMGGWIIDDAFTGLLPNECMKIKRDVWKCKQMVVFGTVYLEYLVYLVYLELWMMLSLSSQIGCLKIWDFERCIKLVFVKSTLQEDVT